MKVQLKLMQRGLLLIAFPLACQILFIVSIGCFFWKLHNQLEKEYQIHKVTSDAQRLGSTLIDEIGTNQIFMISDKSFTPPDKTEALTMLSTSQSEIGWLMARTDFEPEKRMIAAKIQRLTREISKTIKREIDLNNAHQLDDATRAQIMRRAYDLAKEYMSDFLELEQLEEQRRLRDPVQLLRQLDDVQRLLGFGAIASITLALLLGRWYAIGIKRPLAHITQNAVLLSENQELLPALSGTDELSQLDVLFHHTSDAVNDALHRERAMVENAADLICSIDQDGYFTAVNPYVKRMLDYAPADLIGKSVDIVVIAEDVFNAEEQMRKAQDTEQPVSFELRLVRRDGGILDSRWTCLWSTSERRIFAVAHDVTEQKNIQRLKQDFVDMISHDLRSPLTSILGSMTLIAEGVKGDLPADAASEVKRAAKNIESLVTFVNDLLDFQKLEAGRLELHIEEVSSRELFQEALSMVQEYINAKSIVIDVSAQEIKFDCDRARIVQTLINLISNATKFSPEHSHIALDVEESNGTVEISVSDNGSGVPLEFRDRIFGAFEQLPANARAKEGTGLGLAICKLIVEAHHGKIGVTDRVDSQGTISGGSRFWISLPLKQPQRKDESQDASALAAIY